VAWASLGSNIRKGRVVRGLVVVHVERELCL
jgi:hypothetical protein